MQPPVTAVLLTMNFEEPGFDINFGPPTSLDKMEKWFEALGLDPLERIFHEGGDANTHIIVLAGGYETFPAERFVQYLKGLEWRDPANLVLVVQQKGSGTWIWRPGPS